MNFDKYIVMERPKTIKILNSFIIPKIPPCPFALRPFPYTGYLFSAPTVLIFLECIAIIQHVTLYIWLLWLYVSEIHLCCFCNSTSFHFIAEKYFIVWMIICLHTFTSLWIFKLSAVLAIMNTAAINIQVVKFSFHLDKYPGEGLLGQMISVCITL